MNQRARDVLRQAALDGVRQIQGHVWDGEGGYCAVGVLWRATDGMDDVRWLYDLERPVVGCPGCATLPIFVDESTLLVHCNDDHGYDFLKLAELMPVSEEEDA